MQCRTYGDLVLVTENPEITAARENILTYHPVRKLAVLACFGNQLEPFGQVIRQ